MNEESSMNYALALKYYHQSGRGRLMKKFCDEEGTRPLFRRLPPVLDF